MNWTKTPPTKPGVYLFQPKYGKPEAVLLYEDEHDHLLYQEGLNYPSDAWDGQWSGLFVPVEEVEKAYREGHKDAGGFPTSLDFKHSRAHKIVEGKQV